MKKTSLIKKVNRVFSQYNKEKLRNLPQGSYGRYLQINDNIGMKMLHNAYLSKTEAQQSDDMRWALLEASNLRKAYRICPCIPRCYGVMVVKWTNVYYICIVMQHLGNKTVCTARSVDKLNGDSILTKRLLKRGIIHQDLHHGNIMHYKGNYWPVDFQSVIFT